jgi:hypothetical protein
MREFVKLRPEVEGVVQHVGFDTWDLVLIDVTGLFTRDELASREDALAACERLGVRCHEGWGDPRMSRRMSRRDHWNTPDGQRRAL